MAEEKKINSVKQVVVTKLASEEYGIPIMQIQEIIMVCAAQAPFRKQAIHQPIHEPHHGMKFTVAGGRHPHGEGQGITERVKGILDTDLEGMTDSIGVLGHAGGEHRLRNDFESQLHHFCSNVDCVSFLVFPRSQSLLTDLGHAIGHRGHPRAVKDRLDDAAMPFPHFTRAGHQAIAQD